MLAQGQKTVTSWVMPVSEVTAETAQQAASTFPPAAGQQGASPPEIIQVSGSSKDAAWRRRGPTAPAHQ